MSEIDLKQVIKDQAGINEKLSEGVIFLNARLEKAEEVIRFYAERRFYKDDNPNSLSSSWENTCSILMDEGKKAREYLSQKSK